MIDAEFETPSQVGKLAGFVIERVQEARNQVLYVSFLFSNKRVWNALKQKALEGLDVTVFAPPITSYSGDGVPAAYEIYQDAAAMASRLDSFRFYSCPLWWQKDRSLGYLQSFINVPYTLHAKFLVVDDFVYLLSSNLKSAKHYDLCLYSDEPRLAEECCLFAKDLEEFSVDMGHACHDNLVDMVKEATAMTLASRVERQRPYPFRHMLFIAPFYRYEPLNFVRQQIAQPIAESQASVDVMFQHFMPDVKKWSEPSSPGIMETLLEKHRQGVDVRILTAAGVTNQAAIRAEDAPLIRPLLQAGRIRRGTRVHAKFMCTDRGFLSGSMNINPSSLFYSFLDKRKVELDAALHILLPEAFHGEYEVAEERYGTIWQSAGFKSSVEVLLIQNWNDSNAHLRQKLSDFFNQSWNSIRP